MGRFSSSCSCPGIHRRAFLADVGMGFTGLALGAMLHRDGYAFPSPPNPLSHTHSRPPGRGEEEKQGETQFSGGGVPSPGGRGVRVGEGIEG